MEKWSAPAATGSDASGPAKSGSGSPVSTANVTDSLFQMSVTLHALAGIVGVVVLGVSLGWYAFAGGLFAVTGYWMVLLNRYRADAKQGVIDAALFAERARASRFSDPRAIDS